MPRRSTRDDLVVALAQAREELRRSRHENRNLRRGNQILRDAVEPLIHQAPARSASRSSTSGVTGSAPSCCAGSCLPTAPITVPGSAVSGNAVTDSMMSGG